MGFTIPLNAGVSTGAIVPAFLAGERARYQDTLRLDLAKLATSDIASRRALALQAAEDWLKNLQFQDDLTLRSRVAAQDFDLRNRGLELDYARLGESGRQFDLGYGLDRDRLTESTRQFGLGQSLAYAQLANQQNIAQAQLDAQMQRAALDAALQQEQLGWQREYQQGMLDYYNSALSEKDRETMYAPFQAGGQWYQAGTRGTLNPLGLADRAALMPAGGVPYSSTIDDSGRASVTYRFPQSQPDFDFNSGATPLGMGVDTSLDLGAWRYPFDVATWWTQPTGAKPAQQASYYVDLAKRLGAPSAGEMSETEAQAWIYAAQALGTTAPVLATTANITTNAGGWFSPSSIVTNPPSYGLAFPIREVAPPAPVPAPAPAPAPQMVLAPPNTNWVGQVGQYRYR